MNHAADVHRAADEGLITYMRTDSPTLDDTAAQEIREAVKAIYGLDFLSSEANLYKYAAIEHCAVAKNFNCL